MEENHIASPEAATDEPAFVPTLVSDCLNETFSDAARKPRSDGWTPERMAACLRHLAACGVIADACKMVGLSVSSAYALRNRKAGRAFGLAWDAVLRHRARGRLGDELLSRSMNGCIEAIVKDGEVVGERHRYDNRLSMAVLTRLDRLAEKETPDDDLMRAVSEDLDGFLECVESGGDADAFVEALRPPAPAPRRPNYEIDDLDRIARVAGISAYRDVHPFDIDVSDLDPDRRDEWGLDGWIRADRSGYEFWLEGMGYNDGEKDGAEAAATFMRRREEADARFEAAEAAEANASDGGEEE